MKEETMIVDGKEYVIRIGRNDKENWNLIDDSNQYDMWFHLDDNPSPHVVLACKNDVTGIYPKQLIFKCACLCKNYSKFSNVKKIKVIYTHIKNITKSDTIGSVYTKKLEKITV